MSETCRHGSLRRQCEPCDLEDEVRALICLAFLGGWSVEDIEQHTGRQRAYIEACLRALCKFGGEG